MDVDSFIPREEECISTLREMRWPDGVITCPRCGSDNVVKDGVRERYQMYWCKACNFGFNDRSGTIFQDTKVPLRKWFMMAFMMQFKVSVLEISKMIKFGDPYCIMYEPLLAWSITDHILSIMILDPRGRTLIGNVYRSLCLVRA